MSSFRGGIVHGEMCSVIPAERSESRDPWCNRKGGSRHSRDQLGRIETFEPAINAFIIVDRDDALKAAQASEARWQKGEPIGLIDGLGATVKDNVWLKDFPSRRGSLTTPDAPM